MLARGTRLGPNEVAVLAVSDNGVWESTQPDPHRLSAP
jgi:hypothetical protein